MGLECCYICGSDSLVGFTTSGDYVIARCSGCNHYQVNPIPKAEELSQHYQHSDDSFYGNSCAVSLSEMAQSDKEYLRKYYSERIEVVQDNTENTTQRVLDFGCTNGVFVQSLIDFGYSDVYGFDIAEDLVSQGKKLGLKLFSGELETFVDQFPGYFDLIVSYHVFEHIPDPKRTIELLSKLLKPKGAIYINVPHIESLQVKLLNRNSAIIDPPHHIHYFTKDSLTRLVASENLAVLSVETPFWEKTTDTYLELKGIHHNVAVLMRYCVMPLRWAIKKLSLGGTLTVIAKKTG